VKPLYEQLHCYTRTKLEAQYGNEKGQVNGLLPAHLMGNMWQQDWGNLWDMLEPYKGVAEGAPHSSVCDPTFHRDR
jgi:peptidyl-dipeptidase A